MEYERLETLMQKAAAQHGLEVHEGYIGDPKAPGGKRQMHLYGAKEVAIGTRRPQKTYVVGIIEQKAFIGFYFMPIYSHRDVFTLSPTLQKSLKGKSCFHIKKLDEKLERELLELIASGVELYRKEGWL